jgi:hypothetical protein
MMPRIDWGFASNSGGATSSVLSTHFDDSLSRRERGDHCIVHSIECFEQRRISAIAKPHPDKPTGISRAVGQKDKVLVLAYKNPFISRAARPKFHV